MKFDRNTQRKMQVSAYADFLRRTGQCLILVYPDSPRPVALCNTYTQDLLQELLQVRMPHRDRETQHRLRGMALAAGWELLEIPIDDDDGKLFAPAPVGGGLEHPSHGNGVSS